MNTNTCHAPSHRPVIAMPALRSIRLATAAVLLLSLSSCIQPPPPRAYSPQAARHLRELSHDTPVTPMPAAYGGWGYYGYAPYYSS
ncbi:MAG: hypothetical protein NTW21_36490, partial [Verrucomicrobia bacterium]|nr:hypothetical protein [Verrucomicrobiota bacterium]